MNNKIFCTAPFTTMRIESLPEQGIIFKPGCVYQTQTPITTLDEFMAGAEMQDLRHNKLFGTVPNKGCAQCTIPENIGLTSIRQQLLNKPWASAENKIYMLDIFFGNTCNLGCIMCGPSWSSYSAEERYQAGMIPHRLPVVNNVQLALDTIDQLPDLKSISFLGGEFFLVKRNLELVDKIIQKNLQCTITTNASVFTKSMLEKLQQVKNLQLRISVDGTEDTYNFIRYPADWIQLNHNIDVLKNQLPKTEYHINAVIQLLNIQNLHDLLEWANKKIIPTHYQILSGPDYLSWKILTPVEKKNIVEMLTAKQLQYKITHKQRSMIQTLVDGIPQEEFDPVLRKRGIEFLSKLLAHRKINAQAISKQFGMLTELAEEIINTIKVKSVESNNTN